LENRKCIEVIRLILLPFPISFLSIAFIFQSRLGFIGMIEKHAPERDSKEMQKLRG